MGSHSGTRHQFNWERTDCDIWVFNEAMSQSWCKRADAVFQLHKPVIWRNPNNRNDPHHCEWLQSGNTPTIIMQEAYPEIPKAERYPIEAAIAINPDFLSSSVAQAIALAVILMYRRIEVYGVEMETDTEYRYQRDGVAWWCGYARGQGIDVDFHSLTYKYPVYGYGGDIKLDYQVDFIDRLEEVKTKCAELQNAYTNNTKEINKIIIAIGNTGQMPANWNAIITEQAKLASTFGLFDGARQEIERYIKKADDMIKASGDFVFSRQEFEAMSTATAKKREETIASTVAKSKKAEEAFNHVKTTQNPAKRKARMNRFTDALHDYMVEAVKVGMFDGACRENVRLAKRLDLLNKAAGGDKSVEVMMQAYQQQVAA